MRYACHAPQGAGRGAIALLGEAALRPVTAPAPVLKNALAVWPQPTIDSHRDARVGD